MIGNTMTTPRRWWKPRHLGSGLAFVAALAAAGLASPSGAATTELVVVDGRTGLAIGGFDPVAYFTEHAPMLGRGEHEFGHAGAVWRFRNAGNRAAFMADPGVYSPRFGGYDPVGVARGVAVAGNPLFWLIVGGQLYLFYSEETRDSFLEDPKAVLTTSDRNWAAVQHTLSP
jgi:hypothetical protein